MIVNLPLIRPSTLLLTALALLAAGCKERGTGEAKPGTGPAMSTGASAGAPDATRPELTVLITADEGGWLLPSGEGGAKRGGAAEMLGMWVEKEKHCPSTPAASGSPCKAGYDATVALSTGNHWRGPAVSSFFRGESTAEVMARMGYAVSGLGNHELDFGRDQFLKNRQIDRMAYVSANVKAKSPEAKDLELPAFHIVERKGVKLGVVGLSRVQIAKVVMAGRFEGLEVTGYEEALAQAVPQAWSAGADAVVVLADECASSLEPLIQAHPDWKISVVASGHCRGDFEKKVGETYLASPGRSFQKYLRARLSFDLSKPARERVTMVDGKVVEVSGPVTPDADAASMVKKWKDQADAALGEEIGFTKTGLDQSSPQMARWVAEAVRSVAAAEVAILNKGGLRQALPAGKITKGSVYSVMPFENSVLVARLTGAQLLKNLGNAEAIFAGVTRGPKDQFKDSQGKPIDPARTYTVATVEYLYFGGDGFEFEPHDPQPGETGMVWQTPVIEWTKGAKTSPQQPLEAKLK
jgi:2',3'-cyclic-nucleotide 2'-phosphodiesterase (5'-nucleotidase family)